MNSEKPATPEPPVCEFTNWDEFYPIALRYHQSMHQGDDRVIDRIETFRKYMSKDVTEYLGGFVHLHPRFYTNDGWDQWVDDVAEMLSFSSLTRDDRPAWVKALHAKFTKRNVEEPAEDLIARFKNGKCSTRQVWQGLDVLVCNNMMSSTDQRQLFWGALSEDEQKHLVERCLCFNPQDEIWEKEESDLAKVFEQKLSQIIEFNVIDERIVFFNRQMKFCWIMAFTNTLSNMMNYSVLYGRPKDCVWYILDCVWYILLSLIISSWVFMFIAVFESRQKIKKLKVKQNELLIRDSA